MTDQLPDGYICRPALIAHAESVASPRTTDRKPPEVFARRRATSGSIKRRSGCSRARTAWQLPSNCFGDSHAPRSGGSCGAVALNDRRDRKACSRDNEILRTKV